MMRHLAVIWLFLANAVICPFALANDVLVLKPPLVCPSTKMGTDELQAKYDAMWAEYRTATDKAWIALGEDIEAQRANAQGYGNLPLLEFWIGEKTKHAERKEMSWDSVGLKKQWKERFGTLYPARAGEAYTKYVRASATARADLDAGYSKLVAEVTKSGDVAKAKALHAEEGTLASVPAPAQKPSVPPNPAKEGAVAWNRHQYKVFNEKCSWHDAVKRCQAMGGCLVIVNEDKEQAFLLQLLTNAGLPIDGSKKDSTGVWIGATDEVKERAWSWVGGAPLAYANWDSGQPSGNGHYAVLCLYRNGRWDDRGSPYASVVGFICEWDK